jgi:hypothetical protein
MAINKPIDSSDDQRNLKYQFYKVKITIKERPLTKKKRFRTPMIIACVLLVLATHRWTRFPVLNYFRSALIKGTSAMQQIFQRG